MSWIRQTASIATGAVLALAALAPATPAGAAEETPPTWRVTVAPYLWASGLSGDVTVKGLTTGVDASFLDILDATDSLIGVMGRLEVARGPLGGFVDATYIKLGVDDAGPLKIDISNRMWLVEFGAFYRLLDTTATRRPGVWVDLVAGGRYFYIDANLDPPGPRSVKGSQDWVDPIVGGRVGFQLTDHLVLGVAGNVGGFGVGSDFAWAATGLVGYGWQGLGLEWAVLAGYRALGQDYETGQGPQRFRWDVTMHGPILGLTITF